MSGNVGKWSALYGNVMMIDNRYVLNVIVQNLRSNIQALSSTYLG